MPDPTNQQVPGVETRHPVFFDIDLDQKCLCDSMENTVPSCPHHGELNAQLGAFAIKIRDLSVRLEQAEKELDALRKAGGDLWDAAFHARNRVNPADEAAKLRKAMEAWLVLSDTLEGERDAD